MVFYFSFCFSNQTKGSEKSKKKQHSPSLCVYLIVRLATLDKKKQHEIYFQAWVRKTNGFDSTAFETRVSFVVLCFVMFSFFPSCGVALQLFWATSQHFSLEDVNIRRTKRKEQTKTKQKNTATAQRSLWRGRDRGGCDPGRVPLLIRSQGHRLVIGFVFSCRMWTF